MTTAQIQEQILNETGIKTSVKKRKGSMKNHYTFTPMFQGGTRPYFNFDWVQNFKKQFQSFGHGVFGSIGELDIPVLNFTENNPIEYKRERKPKPIDETKVSKGWGSKNSQLRLDKAAARYAKRASRPNYDGVRYW